ncbi:ABC transporter CDR4 [Podospora australis]|uniref:ABC transporter CDR4 n=1 Tax=Podospora australis TaxID=1536484 RepID=A0AAN7AFH1_9PEZI|nr:ABC transporter CDR4 [Podospora australis]
MSAGPSPTELDDDALDRWLAIAPSPTGNARLGICFQNLRVFGYSSTTDYQTTVGTYLFAAASVVRNLLAGTPRRRRVQILHGLDGVLRSGEMLLVLGRPGSGCSTTLKALTGRTYGFEIDPASKVNYQGISFEALHRDCKGATIYQAELDVHFAELTLGQTLKFATKVRLPSRRGPDDGATKPTSTMPTASLLPAAIFGLTGSAGTMMGNDMIRGVSGGEKKRTSIAEAFVAGAPIQAWDNTTRGLDSLTALDVITTLKRTAASHGSAVIVTVYQASQSIYDRFDKVMLLHDGRQIYFGPTARAVQFFEHLGFVKSERQTSADFLTSITHPAERVVKPGFEDKVPRSADEFRNIWVSSADREALIDDINAYNSEYPMTRTTVGAYHASKAASLGCSQSRTSPYALSTGRQIRACFRRGFERLRNNYVPVVAGVIGNSVVALIISSVFYNLDETTASFYKRAVLIFYSIVINAGISAFEVLTMWAARPVVEKHNSYKFYHPFVESAASMICDLPNKVFTSLGFNMAIYFMTNLRRTPDAFFVFYIFSFTCLLTMSMFFRMVGSLSRTMEQSMAPVANAMLLFIIYAGFVIPTRYMHPWLGWIRWINPIGYAYESLMINEFWGRTYACSATIPSGPDYGSSMTAGERTCSSVGSVVGQDFVRGEAYLEIQYGFARSHLWRNFGILLGMMIFFCTVHLVAVEYIPAQRSKGDILVFRRGRKRALQACSDVPDVEAMEPVLSLNQWKLLHEKGVTTSATDVSLRETNIFDGLQKQTAVFHWDAISYDIKTKDGTKRILDEVDGWVKPGTLTALMGATGAGKTTLLDVLASRVAVGVVSGSAYVDGRSRDGSFQRRTGYTQQLDIHLSTATVREALTFSALLRQPRSTSRVEKVAYVEHVLKALDMEAYADAVVGVPGQGLNVEERKRLSIGIELAAKPQLLLFLDEPTSGLDSQTAWSICTLLRRLADSGQAILCTIHQPSSRIFDMFDQLLLLEKGGRTLYFGTIGDNASKLISYFLKNGASRPCRSGENPTEWVLDVTGGHRTSTSTNQTMPWSEKWRLSPERKEIKRQLREMKDFLPTKTADAGVTASLLPGDTALNTEFSVPFATQLFLVTHRIFQEYWRDPTYLYSKIALSAGVGVFNGFSFYMSPLDIQGLINILFSIFLLASIFNNVDQQIIPRFIKGRELFEAREGPSKTYSWVVFVASNLIVEAAWQTLTAVLLFVVWYFPTGLWRQAGAHHDAVGGDSTVVASNAGLMFGLLWIFCVFMSTLSQAIAAGIEHAETAVQMAQLVSSLWLIFCGVLVPPHEFARFWIFMYRLNPLTYLISAMASAAFGEHASISCSDYELLRFNAPAATTCGEYMQAFLSYPGVSGRLLNAEASGECLYCPLGEVGDFLSGVGIQFANRWRDFGFQFVFVAVNIGLTFGVYWLARVPRQKALV